MADLSWLGGGRLAGSLIGGKWLDSDQVFAVADKFTGATLAEVSAASRGHVAAAVQATGRAFLQGAPAPHDRAAILLRTAALIDRDRAVFGDTIVAETGFTRVDAQVEIDRTLVTLRLCAEEATRITGETVNFSSTPGQQDRIGYTWRAPLGVVCAITPFNSPLNTVAHKVGPTLAAGNAMVLKPSQLTPLTAIRLCRALLEAGLPEGLLALVNGPGSRVGNWLVEEQEIAFYTFTGSTGVGRTIQRGAGLRRTQMELGSIASTLICADADLDRAIPRIANACFRKAGQVCTSTQRLYVERAILPEVAERLAGATRAMPAGDPRDPATRLGPMISQAEAQRAQGWIDEASAGQARILCGGTREGALMQPTLITDVQDGMKVVDHEIFAPCVVLLPFDHLEAALTHANNTPYGLAAGVFTRDLNTALRASRALRFGSVHINETSSARADAMPFGGVKASGFGHEGPRYAIRELTEERLVTFNT